MPPKWNIFGSSSIQPSAPDLSSFSDQDRFWTLIDTSRTPAGMNNDKFLKRLAKQLKFLSPEQIVAFQVEFERTRAAAYRWNLWGAAFVIMGGCSDDMFDYFRAWLISMGRQTFDRALTDPDSLAELDLGDDPNEMCDLELLLSAADEVYEKKTGRALYGDLPQKPPAGGSPQGKEWDEDELGTLMPRLGAKFGC